MSLKVETLAVGQLQANCYLVYDSNSRDGLIIDPGDEGTFIADEILRLKINPIAIIATHGHFDHILASWELQMAFNVPFYIQKEDKFMLNYMAYSAKKWLGKEIVEKPPEKIIELRTTNDEQGKHKNISLPLILNSSFIIHYFSTPGHTLGSICLAFPEEKIIFTGDTLFANNEIGRTDLPYSSPIEIKKSIELIKAKHNGWTGYPGHGISFMIN